MNNTRVLVQHVFVFFLSFSTSSPFFFFKLVTPKMLEQTIPDVGTLQEVR